MKLPTQIKCRDVIDAVGWAALVGAVAYGLNLGAQQPNWVAVWPLLAMGTGLIALSILVYDILYWITASGDGFFVSRRKPPE